MNEKPGYYAILPPDVRYDKQLPQGAKLLYSEITALSNKNGYCWASNDYFAKLYSVSNSTIQSWLKSLEDKSYISRILKYKGGSKEVVERFIRLNPLPE
ncbi:MAG: helix-turn-helix domain-containing protein, partial [Lacticaseibacillus paracasei]